MIGTDSPRHRLDDAVAKVYPKYRSMIEFMLAYIRDTLPWDSRKVTEAGRAPTDRDDLARRTIANSADAAAYFGDIDPVLRAVFQMLVSYTEKRLPPRDEV